MKLRVTWLLALLLSVTVIQAGAVTTQPPPRLIADNRTPYVVDVWVFNGQVWSFVSRLGPTSWQAFPNAAPGSAWRATFGQAVREHRVYYVYDPNYAGYQSIWWIQ